MRGEDTYPTILIMDSSSIDREILISILGEQYSYLEVEDRYAGIKRIEEYSEKIKMILLDITSPGTDGFAILETMKETGIINRIPVMVMSSEINNLDIERAFALGAFDYFFKGASRSLIKNRVTNSMAFFFAKIKQDQLEKGKTGDGNLSSNEDDGVDLLTGCLKLMSFTEKANECLRKNPEKEYGLIFYDIDNLTYINNAFGYKIGDRVLSLIGETVREMINEDELTARISDDRFVGLYDRKATKKESRDIFHEVKRRLDEYMKEIGANHHVELFAGIYHVQKQDIKTKKIAQMIDYAVTAHKVAKKEKRKNVVIYDQSLLEQQIRENKIISSLDAAIANHEITLWYQPQIDCRNGDIVGAEVLCRWNSKELGFISPREFIPIFEKDGQICKLDRYVGECACKQLKKWMTENNHPVVPLSINISRRDILEMNLEKFLTDLISKYELSPELLRIEITESAYMDEPEQLIEIVNGLKNRGFTIEMDDFGSGYSSLNMLKEVPVDVLKMDLKFLSSKNEKQSVSAGSIISSVIRMAQGIELTVIAEGVETEEQCLSLHNMGCTIIQGYYFAKPMPMDKFEEYIHSHAVGKMGGKKYSKEISHLHELLNYDSNSAYIFDHYIGSGCIIELTGNHVEVLKFNDKFLEAIGDRNKIGLQCVSDLLTLIQKQDEDKDLKVIKEAVKHGKSEIEIFFPTTGQWIQLLYRLIIKGAVSSYLFCEATNTTDKHILDEQFQEYMKSAEYTMEVMPSGFFRYEADGEQRFSYISSSMLWMLGYKTKEEFLTKFDNRFPNIIYEEDRERVLRKIRNQLSSGDNVDSCEYRIEKSDGTLKWVSDYGHIVTDENGKKWFYVVISDADSAKKAKEESASREKELQILKNATGARSFEYDLHKDRIKAKLLDENGKWIVLTRENFIKGKEIENIFTLESANIIREVIEHAKENPDTVVFHVESKWERSSFKKYRCSCAGVYNENGKLDRVVGIVMNNWLASQG